jgi:hypothetical protein
VSKYVVRNGQRIEVVEHDLGITPRKVRKVKADAFAKIPLQGAALAAKAMRNPALLVYVDLMYRAWKAKGRPFNMPNGRIEAHGVSRWAKNRTLRNLEAAGIITVEWRLRKSPQVTMIDPTGALRH